MREIMAIIPDALTVLATYGIHCGSCSMNAFDTLHDGFRHHHMTDEDMENLLADLNLLYQELPPRPPCVAITKEAALLLKKITFASGSPSTCAIVVDEHQQFVLEISPEGTDHHIFVHPDVPDVRITVSPFILSHVGGSEISAKDGRLRIDLHHDPCCKTTASCPCSSFPPHFKGEG